MDSSDKETAKPVGGRTLQFRKGRLAALFGIAALAGLAMDVIITFMIHRLIIHMVGIETVVENIQIIESIYDVTTWLVFILPWGSYIIYYLVKKHLLSRENFI